MPETRKASAVRAALEGPVSTACPASILQETAQAIVYPRSRLGLTPYTRSMSSRRDRARAANPDLTVLGFPGPAELRRRLPRLILGLLALGVGIAMMVEAGLGVSPYDVLHQGLADLTGLSFGTVVILLGVLVLFLWIPLGQRFGIGTVINTLTVGLIVDRFIDWSPDPTTLWRCAGRTCSSGS